MTAALTAGLMLAPEMLTVLQIIATKVMPMVRQAANPLGVGLMCFVLHRRIIETKINVHIASQMKTFQSVKPVLCYKIAISL